jgi:lipopolysaccharide export LptBFGC system permease protein LptF/lipopolysaccharide export system protein LptA
MKSAVFPFILGLGGFILFVSIELLYQLSEVIVSYKVPIWRLFELLYYNIPMFTVMGIPVGVLLAIFWILSQMGVNSELMALQVHGVSFKKIVIPFLILGAITSVCAYLLSDFVVPDFNHRASETLTRYVYKQPESTIKANQFLDVGDNRYFYVKRFDTEKGTFEDILLYDLTQSDMKIYYAQKAMKEEETGKWKLIDGRVFSMDRDGLMKLDTVFQETEIDLTKDLDEFIRDTSKRAQDLTSKELAAKIYAYKKMGIRTNSLEVEFHTRFANSLGPIIIAFLGVPLSLTFNIKSKSWSVIFTFMLIVLYQGSSAWMSALGKDGEILTPFMASWLPDISFAVIGFILFVLLDTKVMYRFKEMISRFFTFSSSSKLLVLFLTFFLLSITVRANDPTYNATSSVSFPITLTASSTELSDAISEAASPSGVSAMTTKDSTSVSSPQNQKKTASSVTTPSLTPGVDEVLIKVTADDVNYNGEERTIVLTGNVKIEYEKMVLEAPKVTAYLEDGEWVDYFLAESEEATLVTLHQDKEVYQARRIKAFVKRNAYFMYHLRGTFSQKNKQGQQKQIFLVTDKSRSKTFLNNNITEIHTGYLTTCDLEKPHYRFEAGYIVVKNSKEIIAYDLLLYIFNIPILPYPVYFADLTKESQPVEISFSLSGEGGIQTHMKYTYLDRKDETGSILFDTVQKGTKKGAKITIENRFKLPFDTSGYLKMSQESSNDFKDQQRTVDFSLTKTFTNALKLNVFYNSTRVLKGGEQYSRIGKYGLDFSGPFFLKGTTFTLKAQKDETRYITSSKNTYILPSFGLSTISTTLFKETFPILITLSGISFKGTGETPGATPIDEALEIIDYVSTQKLSIVYDEIEIEGTKLVKPIQSTVELDMDFDKDDFTNRLRIENQIPFQNIAFQVGQKEKAFFSFDSAYTVRLGYLRHKTNDTAWRYSENLVTKTVTNLWWLSHQMTHNYVFLIAEGNTSGLDYTSEKNKLDMTTTLQIPFLFSKFELLNSFDFLDTSDPISDPNFKSETTIKLWDTSFSMSTTSPYSMDEKRFANTLYNFDFYHPWGNSNVNFKYTYESEKPIETITNNNTLKISKLGFINSVTEDINFTWTATETGWMELSKIYQKNIFKMNGFGTLKSLQNTFQFELYPLKAEENRWYSISEKLSMEFDIFTASAGVDFKSSNNTMTLKMAGSFPGFSADFDATYNTKNLIFKTIDLTLKKDLHCWENETKIEFEYTDSKLTLTSFATSFKIKSFPEKLFKADPIKKTFDLSIF